MRTEQLIPSLLDRHGLLKFEILRCLCLCLFYCQIHHENKSENKSLREILERLVQP